MARTHSDQAKMAVVLDVMEVSDALKGKSFSITGHLGRPRPEIVEIITRAGGRFEERPKNLWGKDAYLVTNADWTKNSIKGKVSSKFDEARRNGIKIISEDELYKMIIDNDPNMKDEAS